MPLTPGYVFKTYLDHRDNMAKRPSLNQDDREEIFSLLEPVLAYVSRKLGDVYERDPLRLRPEEFVSTLTSWAPSERACYESSRADGGQKHVVIDVVETGHPMFDVLQQTPDELFAGAPLRRDSLARHGGSDTLLDVNPGVHKELRFFPMYIGEDGVTRTNVWVNVLHWPEARKAWNDVLMSRVEEEFVPEVDLSFGEDNPRITWGRRVLHCRVYGILEPLKVRTITAGNAVWYYSAKKLAEGAAFGPP